MSDKIVELNVGGTPYTTKLSTLMKIDNGSKVLRQLIDEGAKDSQVGIHIRALKIRHHLTFHPTVRVGIESILANHLGSGHNIISPIPLGIFGLLSFFLFLA